MKTNTLPIKSASFGSVSSGTLRTEDLLAKLHDELEWQISRNGAFLSLPENFPLRDRLAKLLGEASDAFGDDGETLTEDGNENGPELIDDLCNALNEFAQPYGYFGAHVGDGADFGYWLADLEDIKQQVEFASSESDEFPADDFRGEWLHINERGNCTLYVREDASAAGDDKHFDREIWSVV